MGCQVSCESSGLNLGIAVETDVLECGCGRRNSACSGEMLRYAEELRLRRQLSKPLLTLMLEGAGIKQD